MIKRQSIIWAVFFMPIHYEINGSALNTHDYHLDNICGSSLYSQEKSFIINESSPIGVFLKRHWRQR